MSEKLPRMDLAAMTDDDLADMTAQLSDRLQHLQQQTAIARKNLDRIKTERDIRKFNRSPRGAPGISDHAIIRYLERIKGMDIEAIREELRTIALRAKYERDENATSDRLTDEETGMTLIYSVDRNSIPTMLSTNAVAALTEGE